MSQMIKGVALFVAVVCLVWLAVLWHWDATHRVMATQDIVVYLGLLPVVVFALVLLLRWAWLSAVAKQAAANTAAAAALAGPGGATAPAGEVPAGAVAERHMQIQLLASAVASSCGQTGAEVLAACQRGQPMPELDKALRDDDGLPLLCVRLNELPALDLQAAISATQAKNEAWLTLEPPEHVARALAALSEPLAQTLSSLQPWQEHFCADPQRRLRLLFAWPTDWTEFDQALAESWVRIWLQEHAPEFAPAAQRSGQSARQGAVALWQRLDHLMLSMAREQRDDPVLVAACHSDISSQAVETLEREQRLFNPGRRPKGQMPGEAAAVLLVAGAAWPTLRQGDARGPVQLHRAAFVQRDKSVDAEGRVGSDVLQAAISQALMAAQIQPEQAVAVVSDADRHSARGAELMGATIAQLAKLDASEDLLLLATQTGHVGAAGALIAVATAAAVVDKRQAPCLVMSLAEPLQRLALVLRPASLESPAVSAVV
jgi:hypothetical protein